MVDDARALAFVARVSARAHGESLLTAARRARRARREGGWEYTEALWDGALDPALTEDERRRCVSNHTATTLRRPLNPEGMSTLTSEKVVFHRYCAALGLPTPELYGVLGREGGWSETGRVIAGAGDFERFMAEDVPEEVIVKPSDGGHGQGVWVIRRVGGRLVDHDGREHEPAALYRALVPPRGPASLMLVQERLRNHPQVDAICPSETLQTLRLITMVDAGGRVHTLFAAIRLGMAGGAVDNFSNGETGNGFAEISLSDLRVGPARFGRPDGAGLMSSPALPDGRPVQGLRLPLLADARELVERAAPHFLPARSYGWDVALTTRGPMLVEGNFGHGPWSGPGFRDVVDRMTALL